MNSDCAASYCCLCLLTACHPVCTCVYRARRRLWTGLLHLFFWGSIVLYVVFVLVWSVVAGAADINASFFYAGVVMWTRCVWVERGCVCLFFVCVCKCVLEGGVALTRMCALCVDVPVCMACVRDVCALVRAAALCYALSDACACACLYFCVCGGCSGAPSGSLLFWSPWRRCCWTSLSRCTGA
jgi:hypothetical protein